MPVGKESIKRASQTGRKKTAAAEKVVEKTAVKTVEIAAAKAVEKVVESTAEKAVKETAVKAADTALRRSFYSISDELPVYLL